jgi:two-component system, NarL family, sensor histidine kinase UhpB
MEVDSEYTKKIHQITSLKNIIDVEENERLDISFSLNENVAQMLAAVQLHIGLAKKKINDEALVFIDEAESILKEAIWEIKTLASSISPFMLKNIGFTYLLNDLILLIEDHHEIKCEVDLDADAISSASISTKNILYQAAQLQIINILKCNKIEKVSVIIKSTTDKILLCIKDDGERLSIQSTKESDGLIKLKERIEAFDGSFSIKKNNQGSTLEIIL